MQRRAVLLSCLLACALAGCGGTDSGAIGPVGDVLVAAPATTPAPAPEATLAAPVTEAPTTLAPAPTPAPTVPTPKAAPAAAGPRPVVATAPAPVPALPVATPGGCDPSYPGVCIRPGPPDLDCADIPHRRFTVIAPDPHRFDGNDDDGIGCEMP